MKSLWVLIYLISFGAIAAPDCNLALTLGNATIQATNSQQVVQQPFQIFRQHPNDNRCAGYILYFSKGSANSYQRAAYNTLGQPYLYNLHSNINLSGILKDKNDALSFNEVVFGATPNRNSTYDGQFYISVTPSGNNPYAGTFTDNVQVSYYRASNVNDQNLEGVNTFTLTIVIPPAISLSLVDEGGTFNASSTTKVLDFGNFIQNQEMGADLLVNSNTPYQIRFSSLNDGKLKNNTDTVNYQAKVNQNIVSLVGSSTTPITVATKGTSSAAGGDRYNIKIKITEAPDNKTSGLYQDSITITAIAN